MFLVFCGQIAELFYYHGSVTTRHSVLDRRRRQCPAKRETASEIRVAIGFGMKQRKRCYLFTCLFGAMVLFFQFIPDRLAFSQVRLKKTIIGVDGKLVVLVKVLFEN